MPRTLHPELRDCLERANPYVEYRIEIAEPDVGKVLRRQDEFTQAPSLVSLSPANSLSASARGSLILTPTPTALASFTGTSSSFDLNIADASGTRRYKGLSWTIDPAFSRATLKNILAKVRFMDFALPQKFECQIYQITRTPGVKVQNVGTARYTSTAFTEYTFTPLVSSPPVVTVTPAMWAASAVQQLNFDFANYGLILENAPTRAVTPDQTGILPKYLIVIRLVGQTLSGTGHYTWLVDTTTTRTIAGVGTFERVNWARENEQSQWSENPFADVPNAIINIEGYPASGQGIYLLNVGAVPKAQSTGRIEFQRALPPGTAATIELSTAGSGGPWTVMKHGDAVTVKQLTYHIRTTLTSDAAHYATPEIIAQGVEFRIPVDVSVESIPTLPTREVALPWPKASIPEGKIRTVRTGIRDYLDVGTQIASTSATSRLEADIFLSSRHPSITRDKWHRLERMMVTNRLPSATSEEFTLLSYASRLKRKIPQKAETLNSVHVVTSSTTAQVTVNGAAPLPGTTTTGNEYDGKNYYMRVRSTTATNIPIGYVAPIQGNTSVDKLDFTPSLPQALVAGDVIEVHSGVFQTESVSWNNYDPADVWWEVLTNLLAIPTERIGLGSLPRGGRPPKVTDIAPGDATTQAKRRITGRISEETEGDKVLDVLSAIMGGVTLEIDGQIVFVQIVPLVDITGAVTVPLPRPAAVFDLRDFSSPPQTPPGIEARATVVSAKYGIPATAASPDSFPGKTTSAVDGDALLWLQQQDLEEYGTASVPDEISKWLYNTTDQGLYLASVLGAQLVKVASTGLRVWPLSMSEKQPKLVPGDVIVIALDGYTDYDPSTQTEIKGPMAVRGVLVRVGNEGRQLSMFVPGLRDNVQLITSGGVGALTGLGSDKALYSLVNFRPLQELPPDPTYPNGALVYGWDSKGALVSEIWAGYLTFAHPFPPDPFALVAASSSPLPSGVTTITVPKPVEGSALFLQVEPRNDVLGAGDVIRVVVNAAASQLPSIELDDAENGTIGTQFWSITERGLAVIAVEVQTQTGTEPISAFGPPSRSAGAASTVRGGLLAPGQYEHDIALDATRLAWIMPRLTLSNGSLKTLGPFGFDRDKKPNILSLQLVGTTLTILCDSDTKSIKVSNSGGTWIYQADGVGLTVDVSKTGTNGASGLGASASDTYTITAQSDPLAYVDGDTLIESRTQVIGGSTAPPPTASWQTPGVIVSAPATNGSANAKINLFASAAPVGWTVKVYIYVGLSSSGTPTVDHTADLTPALSAPPTVATDYTYATSFPKHAHTSGTALVTMKVRADLVNGSGVVQDTRSMQTTWYS